MNTVIPATVARNNFFDILNRVLYGNEVIYITKTGSKTVAKIEGAPDPMKILKKLAGSWSDEDADMVMKAIAKARSYPKRKVLPFD